jgi:diacylglycerol kinase family enzyme
VRCRLGLVGSTTTRGKPRYRAGGGGHDCFGQLLGLRLVRRRQIAAIGALVITPALLILAVAILLEQFPSAMFMLAAVALAIVAGWYGLLRRGAARVLGTTAAGLALTAATLLLVAGGHLLEGVLIGAGMVISLGAARAAFRLHTPLGRAVAPHRPVLFFNPKSGGGKAERFSLVVEAGARGIEPIELQPGSDLGQLVRDAVAAGADALAMAGGDGSQAIVAAIAAELNLPYACVPAGTRNHFALDLGVDREDVVGALDAFVDGGERRVDLGEVNGRVFVNNVSLGLYADAVQRAGYRDAKLRTLLETVPDVLGPEGAGLSLRWTGPGGHTHHSGAAILVSNNRYRLDRAIGSGTRPRIDDGLLGITVVSSPSGRGKRGRLPQRPWREWSAPAFEVDSDQPVAVGIDGEAARLDPPLRFRIRPGALRVRIARAHPGASPSAAIPERLPDVARSLARIAAGDDLAPPSGRRSATISHSTPTKEIYGNPRD